MTKSRGRGYLAIGMVREAANEGIITEAEVENDAGFKELLNFCLNGDVYSPKGHIAAMKQILWAITTKKVAEETVREKLSCLLALKKERRREKRRLLSA